MARTIRSPRGTELTCKNWLIEAAYRMLQNNLDPQVAFDPDNFIVYGGRGKAARNWVAFDAILDTLRALEPDETLLVQSGKPVAVFKTHTDAPRVLLANSNIVPAWATQQNFDKWEAAGLIMYGQMTAGSWIYIGTQGILQGTYETFGALAQKEGWESLKGKFVLTAGLGEMGGAQAQAITFNGGVGLLVDVDKWRIERREFDCLAVGERRRDLLRRQEQQGGRDRLVRCGIFQRLLALFSASVIMVQDKLVPLGERFAREMIENDRRVGQEIEQGFEAFVEEWKPVLHARKAAAFADSRIKRVARRGCAERFDIGATKAADGRRRELHFAHGLHGEDRYIAGGALCCDIE